MTAASDALRNTLDTLHLDPKAKEDRHYLITVLRRLGYTEEEIRVVMEEKFEPVEAVADDERVIEVEYLASSEVREFEPVVRMAREEETLVFREVAPPDVAFVHVAAKSHVHAVASPEADPDAWPTEQPAWDEPKWDAETEPEWPTEPEPAAAEAEVPMAWPEQVSETDGPQVWGEPDPVAPAEPVWEEVAPVAEAAEPESRIFPPLSSQEPDAPVAPAAPAASDAPVVNAAVPDVLPEGPYQHNDYTLHARDVELSTGKSQRIYFFAKGTPRSGTPTGLPEGYEVRENDRTGLPFLSRSE